MNEAPFREFITSGLVRNSSSELSAFTIAEANANLGAIVLIHDDIIARRAALITILQASNKSTLTVFWGREAPPIYV